MQFPWKKQHTPLLAAGLLMVFLSACAGPPPREEAVQTAPGEFIDTSPGQGELVFLGVAGKRSRMRESIALALEEAARRVAIFHGVEGEFFAYSSVGGRLLDYKAETGSSLRYDPAYRNYLDTLEFDETTDVFEGENAVFVRVRCPGSLGFDYRALAPGPGGKPSWIERPPETIGGYAVGVGLAGRRNAHRDTVIASYENAVFSIIRDLSAAAAGGTIDYRGEGFLDISAVSRSGINARGRLTGFYALETWTDPGDKSVWTLAVAKGGAF